MEARVESADLVRVADALRASDTSLQKQMAAELRSVAAPIRDDLRSAVRGLSTAGARGGGAKARLEKAMSGKTRNLATATATGKRHVTAKTYARLVKRSGLREAIAAGIRIEYRDRATSRSVGVTVKASSSTLPGDQKTLPRAMNKGTWRHPVFGTDKWVTQTVTPADWWDATIRRHHTRVAAEVAATFDKWATRVADNAGGH